MTETNSLTSSLAVKRMILIACAIAVIAGLGAVMLAGGERGEAVPVRSLTMKGIEATDLVRLEPRVASAIERAKRHVSQHHRSAEAWGSLGNVCHVHEIHEPAMECYEQARELDPRDFRWPYFLGIVLEDAGRQQEKIIEAYQGAVDLRPEYTPARVRLGEALLTLGHRQQAEAEFLEAIAADEGNLHARLSLAWLAEQRGDDQLALDYLHGAQPDAAKTREGAAVAARVLRRLGRADAATPLDEVARQGPKALRDDPAMDEVLRCGVSAGWLTLRGNEALRAGRRRLAEQYYREAAEAQPDVPVHHLNLANILQKQGELEQSAAAYLKAIELEPNYALAHRRLARLWETVGRTDEAIKHYRLAAENDPGRSGDLERLGTLLLSLKRTDEAIEIFEKAIDYGQAKVSTYLWLSASLVDQGREDHAARILEDGLALHDDVRLRTQLAWHLATSPDESVRDGIRAQELAEVLLAEPKNRNALALSAMAAALAANGRIDEALQTARRAMELTDAPGFPLASRVRLEEMIKAYERGDTYRRESP